MTGYRQATDPPLCDRLRNAGPSEQVGRSGGDVERPRATVGCAALGHLTLVLDYGKDEGPTCGSPLSRCRALVLAEPLASSDRVRIEMKSWPTSALSLAVALSIGALSARSLMDSWFLGLLLLILAVAGSLAFGPAWFNRLSCVMSQDHLRRSRRMWILLGLLFVICLGAAGFFIQNRPVGVRFAMVVLFTLATWMVLYFSARGDAQENTARESRRASP